MARNERRAHFQCARALIVGLTYGSLAFDRQQVCFYRDRMSCRSVSKIYYDGFTMPCAVIFLLLFRAFQTCELNLDNAPSKLLGRLVAMPAQSSPFPHVLSNNFQTLQMFHLPSTTHAALPGRSFNKNHWHVTTNLAAQVRRHYCNMCVEGLKSNTLRVLIRNTTTKSNSFLQSNKPHCLLTGCMGCVFELKRSNRKQAIIKKQIPLQTS